MTMPQRTPHDNRSTEDATRETRADIIERHMPLVRYAVNSIRNYASLSTVVDHDDLIGYGAEGLIRAVDTFNPDHQVRFSTWAVLCIRSAIQDALRSLDPLPRSLRSRGKEIERVSFDLANRNGRWPTDDEIAAEMGLPLNRLRQSQHDLSKSTVSLDAPAYDNGTDSDYSNRSAMIPSEDVESLPEPSLDVQETARLVRSAVADLPERERMLVESYYWQGRNLKEIADSLSVSESRGSQLHKRALGRLRQQVTAMFDEPDPVHHVA